VGSNVVRIAWVLAGLTAVTLAAPAADGPTPLDRAVATVNARGGHVEVLSRQDGKPHAVAVDLGSEARDADLPALRDFPEVRRLNLNLSDVTDAGLAGLTHLKGLRELDLTGQRIGDAGMRHLAACTDLQILLLYGTEVTDAGLKNLIKAFHSYCHHAARVTGAEVQAIRDPYEGGPSNYAMARIQFSDNVVVVLVNSIRPIIAFAKCPAEGQITFEYIDCPKLADAFLAVGEYAIATSEELNRPLLREMCKNLASAELKRVRYFRPKRVGDVVFNYWD
jgi:hypothetical protein